MALPGTPIMEQLQQIIRDNPDDGWDKAWQKKITPWDSGEVQPPLYDLLKSNEVDLPRTGRAFVPGCGKGYDAIYIASTLGLATLGVDISQIALTEARELLAKANLPEGAVTFKDTDFFTMKVRDEERFDIIYDYTFFVAIPPARRPEWGQQISSLIKPGGYLITLVFPLDPPQDVGPPFFVRPEHYPPVLGEGWEKVLDKIPERSIQTHVNRERLVVWKRV